jgi:hypothetical protein
MNTAGNILSTLFDERFLEKARGYSKLYDSWAEITAKNGIAAAAAYSRIKDVDRGILLIETDHPGWKQILQTKQSQLLDDFRQRFPKLEIFGISLILSQGKPRVTDNISDEKIESILETKHSVPEQPVIREPAAKGYDAVKDADFKEKLIKLGQAIAAGEKAPEF